MSGSQDLLADTLARVARETGIGILTLNGLVERVDVHERRGITLELSGKDKVGTLARSWYRGDWRSIVRMEPHRDRHLPIATQLPPSDLPLAWRPGRRMVLANSDPQLISKGYRKGRVGAPRIAHALFHQVTRDSDCGLLTPRVVGLNQELGELVFERLVGKPVQIVAEAADFFFGLGEGLARAQLRLMDAPLPIFGVADELDVLEKWSKKVLFARGELPVSWRELFLVVCDAADSIPKGVPVGAHRDLHDGQLIDVQGLPGLIDFDLACRADANLDPANLLAHLELRLLQGLAGASRSGVDACSEALLEGLGGPQAEAWPRLRFYQATAFLRLSLVYSVRPRWQHLSPKLVAFAKRCLEDLVRIA